MEFWKKYRHVGFSYPSVPSGWKKITEKAIIDIEKEMWPRWMPMFVKRWIHYLATGNSVVRMKYLWAHKLRSYLTNGQMIFQIKDKFAELRIYGSFNDQCYAIIEKAEIECDNTCEFCSKNNEDIGCIEDVVDKGWVRKLCIECKNKIQ